jgi:phosphatidate phosphatase LPIN
MDKILNFFSYNPTLVSGAMDILVIKQPNGTYKGTPLRVKFGQWSILKPKEKEVKLKINDNIINIPIKLNESGEAYIKKINKVKNKSFDINKSENGSSNSMSDNSGISVEENIRNSNENSPEKNDDKIVFDDKKEKDDNDLNIKSYTINDENIKNEDNKIIIQNIDNNNNSNKINNLLQNENIKDDSYNCQNEKNQFKLELSDCWNIISKNKNKKNFSLKTEFEKNKISKEQFFKDPWKILNSNNLAIKIDNNIYTWKVVAPMILAELAFDSPLPEDSFNNLTQSQGGLFWKTIYKDTYKIDINEIEENNNENIKSENNNSTSSNSPQLNSKKHNNLSPNQNNSNSPLKISSSSFSNNSSGKNSPSLKSNNKKKIPKYKESHVFTSNQFSLMNLNYGKNVLEFTITSYRGIRTLKSHLYLWNYNDRILVSDLDGTISRSDLLGQLSYLWGGDWSHKNITKLYNDIYNNGYKILYLTARTMCQHKQTKEFLYNINQNNITMPEGPILMSKDDFISAFKTEIIDKKPQTMKISSLLMVLNLFPNDYYPFYSGIGNKNSDAIAYRSVGVNTNRIYIINEKGKIYINNENKNFYLTYEQMDEQVDQLFPIKGYNSLIWDGKGNYFDNFKCDMKKVIEGDIDQEIEELLKGK